MGTKRGKYFQCEQCGETFYRSPSYLKRGYNVRYCSRRCYSAACEEGAFVRPGPRENRKTGQHFDCPICGEKFYRKPSLIKRGITKTCGKSECLSQWMQKENNPFWGKEHSPEVKRKLSEAKTAKPNGRKRTGPPKGYKHTPEARAKMSAALRRRWRENRDEMLSYIPRNERPKEELRYRRNFTPWQRKNWKDDVCAWCKATDELVLDHIIPVMDDGTNIRENCQTLCRSCNLWKMVYVDRPAHLARLALQGG